MGAYSSPDIQAVPLWFLYAYCMSVLQLEESAAAAAAAYPELVPSGWAARIPELAGRTAAWLSGTLTSLRDVDVLPAASASWPDGEREEQSEAAAELGLEILILIAISSALVPALLGFFWRLVCGAREQDPAQERRGHHHHHGHHAPADARGDARPAHAAVAR
jgi:hypothetical protein